MSSSAEREGFVFAHKTIDSDCVFWRTPLVYATVNLKPIVPGRALCAASPACAWQGGDPADQRERACVRVCADVLVIPRRLVKRFAELTTDEVQDMWISAQNIGAYSTTLEARERTSSRSYIVHAGRVIERHYEATSLTFAIQDGAEAGQTMPHVHVRPVSCKASWRDCSSAVCACVSRCADWGRSEQVHVIPRRAGDFAFNDQVYHEVRSTPRVPPQPTTDALLHASCVYSCRTIRSGTTSESHVLTTRWRTRRRYSLACSSSSSSNSSSPTININRNTRHVAQCPHLSCE